MSSRIWTPAGLSSEARPWQSKCWRVVEAQHKVSTLKLVDTIDEQILLESLIEESKPTLPPECSHLDFLLSTPFRYGAAYPKGSRFRRPGKTLGVFYASEAIETAIAETAFYRLLFYAESPESPWPADPGEYSAFSISAISHRTIDLAASPFFEEAARWSDPVNYEETQSLADMARSADIDVIRYTSIRDAARRANVALLSCNVFAESVPVERQTWRIHLSSSGVQAICEFPRSQLGFDQAAFAGDPRIAAFNWHR